MVLSEILAQVAGKGTISADDVLAVRRWIYGGDAAITPDEMEHILAVDAEARSADRSWTELLSEAGADFLVNQQPPAGYVSEDNAAWITERISREGVIKTRRQLDLLVHVLERATSAPGGLARLALLQVRLFLFSNLILRVKLMQNLTPGSANLVHGTKVIPLIIVTSR